MGLRYGMVLEMGGVMSAREDGTGLESGNKESGKVSCRDWELRPDEVDDDGSTEVMVVLVVGTSLERCELDGIIRVSGCVED